MPNRQSVDFIKMWTLCKRFFYESLSVVRLCLLFTLFHTFYGSKTILIDRIIAEEIFLWISNQSVWIATVRVDRLGAKKRTQNCLSSNRCLRTNDQEEISKRCASESKDLNSKSIFSTTLIIGCHWFREHFNCMRMLKSVCIINYHFFLSKRAALIFRSLRIFNRPLAHTHTHTETPLPLHTYATAIVLHLACASHHRHATNGVHFRLQATGGRGDWNEPNIIYKSTSKPFPIFSLNYTIDIGQVEWVSCDCREWTIVCDPFFCLYKQRFSLALNPHHPKYL